MTQKNYLFAFLVVLLIPTGASAGTVQLPQTGQTHCYNTGGTGIDCAGTGQDGDVKAGVAWPNPRFTDNGDQTVTDNLTGLVWAGDANLMKTRDSGFDKDSIAGDGKVVWQHALDYVKKLNAEGYLGHQDWRLPNVIELESLVNAGEANPATWLNSQGFVNVRADWYWSSGTYADYTEHAWGVYMKYDDRGVSGINKSDISCYAWPVRSGTSGSTGSSIVTLPRTGQATCYDAAGKVIDCSGATGQDGELRMGAAWPAPRFTDNGDETVTDNLTGLMWTKNGETPGPESCNLGIEKTWQGALDHIKCLNTRNYLGHNNWRLPNRKELRSLVNDGQPNSAYFLNSAGFMNVQADWYWSSSTYVYNPNKAWIVYMWDGYVDYIDKSYLVKYYVWPVRTSPALGGDINNDSRVTLSDAIIALRALTGIVPPSTVSKGADISLDGKIGMAEVLYILQLLAGMR